MRGWCLLLSCLLPLTAAPADPAILQIRILEGEGLAYAAGSRATRGITVFVTDETGKPVDGAAVSFRLPDEGPGGTFSTGAKTEVANTAPDGRATIWGMQWNKTLGAFEVRITAVKGQARAGIVCPLYINEAIVSHADTSNSRVGGGSSHKWLWITLAVVGAAGAGAAAAMGGKSSPAAAPAAVTGVKINPPTVSLGHP